MARLEAAGVALILLLQSFRIMSVLAVHCNISEQFRVTHCTMGMARVLPAPERVMPTIYLNNSKILDITEDAFDTVAELQKLYLNNNLIVEIKVRWFMKLVNLAYVDLSGNQIANYHPGTFQHQRFLQKVFLGGNKIQVFEGRYDNFARTTIDLSNNPLAAISLDRIHTLYINNTNVTELHIRSAANIYAEDAKLQAFSAIEGVTEMLHLRGNHFRSISNFSEGFGQLYYLDLSQNPLGSIASDAFQNLVGLRHLNLSRIDLYGMYYGMFSSQRALEVLDLSYNFLWHLNLNKVFPARLRELYVLGNAIWKVTDSRKVMRSLEKIGIAGNEMSCERLFKLYYKGVDRGVQFYTPPHMTNFTSDNVAGMPCRNVI